MKKIDLKKLVSQIKKYNLEALFDSTYEFDDWLNSLNNKQINNFNSLDIEPDDIKIPKCVLINKDLLNCNDFLQKLDAMMKLKYVDRRSDYNEYLFGTILCSKSFLNSKNYYKDMETVKDVTDNVYPLLIISHEEFVNSPYHDEDLKLIMEADNDGFPSVAEALFDVAHNIDSIKNPYHREDMKIISKCENSCLQSANSYPEESVNNLAVNTVSLKDKYHIDNMKILAQKPSIYLYELMTNQEIINGKYYRDEINTLVNAESDTNSYALFMYISNHQKIMWKEYLLGHNSLEDLWNIERYYYKDKEDINKKNNPNYLKYLDILSKADKEHVLYVESLLSNKLFVNSENCENDLKVFLSIEDKELLLDVYRFLVSDDTVNSKYHNKDLNLILNAKNSKIRTYLVDIATDSDSINSVNHEYDMEYVSKLDWNNIDPEIFEDMKMYLLYAQGINHPNHVERLEKLLKGERIIKEDSISSYLDYLEGNSDNIINTNKPKIFTKIKKIFNTKKVG